jgi:hypothetical protein
MNEKYKKDVTKSVNLDNSNLLFVLAKRKVLSHAKHKFIQNIMAPKLKT